MVDETNFYRFLKRMGKKEHVSVALVRQVKEFEAYLMQSHQLALESATALELEDYLTELPESEKKERLRSVALYYKFNGNEPLAQRASDLREEKIAAVRKSFKLRDFRGVDLQDIDRLEACGVCTVDDILSAGATPQSRQQLATESGVSPQVILELVKLSDISRVGAIKSIRARLYYDAGLDTPDKFAAWDPDALRHMLVEFVSQTGFEGIAPLPKEVRNAVETARNLPRLVTYD